MLESPNKHESMENEQNKQPEIGGLAEVGVKALPSEPTEAAKLADLDMYSGDGDSNNPKLPC